MRPDLDTSRGTSAFTTVWRREGHRPQELEIHFVKGERRGTILLEAKVRRLMPPAGGQTRFWVRRRQDKRQLVGKTAHLCKRGVARKIACSCSTRENRTGEQWHPPK